VESRNHSKKRGELRKSIRVGKKEGCAIKQMKKFVVTLTKQGQTTMKIVVHAQNQQDAKRQAQSMHPGWNVNRIDG
jgi:hypothetical protein